MGKDKSKETLPTGGPTPGRAMLGPLDVQQKEFRVSRFGGYKMRDVDEFLDGVTDSLSALVAENERLRKGAPAPIVGAPDLDDVSRQADEIIQRARTEATRIVGEAKVAASGSGGGDGSGDRAAVNAFLSQEREFLQSLAGLVQGHAETVKGMSKAARKKPAPTAASTSDPVVVTPEVEAPEAPVPSPPAAAAPAEATPTSPPEAAPPASPEPTVVVEEPEPASVGRSDGDDESSASDGDRSLRDLFWGED
jgi:DivIVA domain-containing protein